MALTTSESHSSFKDCEESLDRAIADAIYYNDPSRLSHITTKLNNARKEALFTDITLCVENVTFPCHKVILEAGSPYFRAVFQHDPEACLKKELFLQGLTAVGVEHILDFLYTSQLKITLDNAMDIMEAGDFLQYRSVVETCSTFLLQHINTDNCLQLYLVAEAHLCWPLAEAAWHYAISHFDKVCQSTDFEELAPNTLLSYLEVQHLHVPDETVLLTAIAHWLTINQEEECNLDPYIKHVKLNLISSETVCSIMNEKPVLAKSQILSEKIKDLQGFCTSSNEGSQTCPIEFTNNELSYNSQDNDLAQSQSFSEESAMKTRTPDKLELWQMNKRPVEVLVLIPRETAASKYKAKTEILFFCPLELKWKVLTRIPIKNRYLYSGVVNDNVIYITGGEEYEVPVASACSYDVDTDRWKDVPAMLESRSNHSSASMGGSVYVVGGKGGIAQVLRGSAEEYNPHTCQWSRLANIETIEGIGRCAVVPLDGKLYIIGGTASSRTDSQPSDITRWQYCAAQYYDPREGKWYYHHRLSELLKMHGLSVGVGDCLPYSGLILIIDENTRGRKMKLYNPCTARMQDFLCSHGQHRFGGYVIQHDVLYCIGGVAGMYGANDMVHYHPLKCSADEESAQGWRMLTPLPAPYSHHTCAAVYKVLEEPA